MAAAGAAGGEGLDVDQVYSNFVYEGSGSARFISNGIALADGLDGTSVEFDGSSDYLSRSSDFTSNSDGKTLTFSAWVLPHNTGSVSIYNNRHPTNYNGIQITLNNLGVDIYGTTSSGTGVVNWQSSSGLLTQGEWNHILISIDAANSSNDKLYVNDVDRTSTWTSYAASNNNIDFTTSNHVIGKYTWTSSGFFDGLLAHVYLDYTYRDLSTTSNRRIFIDANGGSTSTSSLSALNPIMYLPMTNTYSLGKNLGTGGDLTASGSPAFTDDGVEYQSGVGEGGMVWIKYLTSTSYKQIMQDTVATGTSDYLQLNSNQVETSTTDRITSFRPSGFNLGTNNEVNQDTAQYVAHTFRKASKFFDIVTYSGNATNRTISHNLGMKPGFMIVKSLDVANHWYVYHRSMGTNYMRFDETDGPNAGSTIWNSTEPTDSVFSVGTAWGTNRSGYNFVALLFGHHNGDGGFGPNGDQDIIKCDEYTGNGSNSGPTVNVGFEPQWLLIKPKYGLGWQANIEDWIILNDINGVYTAGSNDYWWNNNKTTASQKTGDRISFTSTGFKLDSSNSQFNHNGREYIYVAIRRGPLAEPTSATDVFSLFKQTSGTGAGNTVVSATVPPFPIDLLVHKWTSSAREWDVADRQRGHTKFLQTNGTNSEATEGSWLSGFNRMEGYETGSNGGVFYGTPDSIGYFWKRAPGYFDVVTFLASSAGTAITHNLGVVPEMIWVKGTNVTQDWYVYHKDLGNSAFLEINDSAAATTSTNATWNSTSPTATQFTVGGYLTAYNYIAYLFATLAGISKVGSFSHTFGSDTNVDCGFSSGARFVLVKRHNDTGNWTVWDTARGIVAGNDPRLFLNSTAAENTSTDAIDPYSQGFTITGNWLATGDYIFYAIA